MWLMPMASTVVGAANVRRMFSAWGDHARRLTEHVTVLSTPDNGAYPSGNSLLIQGAKR